MISSASTLLLATLVFNAASVFGAPIRNVDTSSESVARAEMTTPVQPVARAAIVDVEDNRRRSRLGHIARRSARLVSEIDQPHPETVAVREPEPIVDVVAPVVESRERRFPRRALHDLHTKRQPAVTVKGTTYVPVVEPRERRFPRRALLDRHTKREPATSIKEKTTVVEKVTVLDTPADVAAFAAGNPGAGNVTTLSSSTTTSTIVSGSSVPTSTATDSVSATSTGSSASATASASASSTTDSASATATSTTDSGSATASSTSSATDSASATASATSTSSGTDATATASSTSSTASVDPTATPAPAVSASNASPALAVALDPTVVRRGSFEKTSTLKSAPNPNSVQAVGPSPPTDSAANPNSEQESGPVRRGIYVKASTEPILRRVAYSGASWASAVRRQLNSH